ncbi:nuclear apoptosis-inducing factor 1-like isoform X2 [Penaeus chinensis]|uniref:nuclear apoptosis-inducing factor 1-like isoform X2 n=1 Tax=Penaeus chinensis TaxID=139456 RepID=UPI001FB63528|nr:nuclear apoptosis-inducing factor 1-like isoform X2 [Penaeus chinensis]XP_047472054.1 nuclear apoptosis-inducing factor 1-like isoform X2 [Penaeus chinensis]
MRSHKSQLFYHRATPKVNNAMEGPTQKKRRPNFSDEEMLALIEGVATKKNVVLGKLDNRITAQVKSNAWDSVTKEVNLVARVPRNVNEVRRKFTDLRAAVKKKAAQEKKHMGGTGGGPAVLTNYTPVEEAMLTLIEPVAITGLLGVYENETEVDVTEPTPGPSEIAAQIITDSAVIVTLDEGTSQEQEMTIPIVSMDHTYSSELPPFLLEDSNAQDGFSATVQQEQPFQEQSRSRFQLESERDSRHEVVHGRKSRSEERRILPDMLQVQTNIESHLKQLVSSVKDIASALQTIAGVMKDKA